ncbi:MAG: WecB/TagA/CpsF family glycosyltransferase, partial [bacterium]|nr:WecB/TagA/CpsF family glycosyltransferase [bacterium]
MDILGVRIDNLGKKEILEKVSDFLNEYRFRQIATINPEIILAAQKDEEFKKILNNCDLNIADGAGVKFAFWRFGKRLKCRITGIDLMLEILKIANEKRLKIFLAANSDGLSAWEETRDAILNKYPSLRIEGENINIDYVISHQSSVIIDSNIIFCNFGAPYQEKFLNSAKGDKIRLTIGVGSGFDYLTGKLKRAPKWMRFFGFEWFWRLILQPKRIKRIFRAVIIFPIKIIF